MWWDEKDDYDKMIHDYLQESSARPPPGIVPNLVDPPSLQEYNVLCQTICLTIVTSLVFVRIYTKSHVLKNLGWDDYTSVAAWLGLIAFGAVLFECDQHGGGRHAWDVRGKDAVLYLKFLHVVIMTYALVILVTKVSILLLYLRIFSTSRTFRILTHLNLWTNVIFYIIGFFVALFMCRPVDFKWNLQVKNGECFDEVALELASAIFNILSDFAILILPMYITWKLQMQTGKKIAVLAVFATGAFGCITSIVRVGLMGKIYRNPNVDQTWNNYPLELWSYAEISAGIICGCMPALPAFCRHVREHLQSSSGTVPSDSKQPMRSWLRHPEPGTDTEILETTLESV